LSSTLHFSPDVIDKMKLYLAVIYMRRLKKGGFFGKEKKESFGSLGEFTKFFGTEVKEE